MSPTPDDVQSAQQALVLLEKVQAKVITELWTTLMLVGGLVSVFLSEILKIAGFPGVSSLFIIAYGYTMTWVPATAAHWLGWGAVFLGIANIVKCSLAARDHKTSKA